MWQDHLLYFPSRASVEQMESGPLRAWPSAADFRGLVAEPPAEARATAIVFHGNAGHAGHRGYYAAALGPLGIRVVLAEYPGYGPRTGELGERSLVDDAARSIELVERQFGVPLLVVGESLGAGVAAAAVARRPQSAAGVLLITPWDQLANVGAHHYPWLPVRWLLRDRYDSVEHLAAYAGPVAVAVAERDDIVPARFGRALHEALRSRKRLAVIAGAGHNDWVMRVDGAWWREMVAFLLEAPPSGR
jgi:pimeloyl-ACP methyl ester carboxylesterase